MIKLYHHPLSVRSRFVRLVLGECEATPELLEERTWERRQEFLLLNPTGEVPVLAEHDGPAISGVWAIAEYLDETRGFALHDRRLLPSSADQRAEVRRICEWFLFKFDDEVTSYLVEEKFIKRERAKAGGGSSSPDSSLLRAARSNVRTHLFYVEHLLSARNWLAGDRMSYADLAAAAALSVADYLGEVPWQDATDAKDWYMRMKSRPAFRPLRADQVRGHLPPEHYANLDF